MADLDPFGRSKDEDPLAALGWVGEETATGTEEPPPEPAPDAPAQRTRRPASPSVQRVRAVSIVGALIAVAAGVVLAAVGGNTAQVDRVVTFAPPELPAIEPVQPAQPAQPGQPVQPEPARQAPAPGGAAPVGLGRGSLLLPTAFERAITRLRGGGYKGLTTLRVAPERINATLITRGGSLRYVQITPDGALRTFGAGTRDFGGLPTMPLNDVDGHAPLRLTTSAAGRLSVSPSRVNYLVYTRFARVARWNVYFKDGQIFSADARGRITRRIS